MRYFLPENAAFHFQGPYMNCTRWMQLLQSLGYGRFAFRGLCVIFWCLQHQNLLKDAVHDISFKF